ncbi:MAG: cysteine hydrolase [FCB group bacterium]|nr:cysteine hydrolase [FCB group bacterium]
MNIQSDKSAVLLIEFQKQWTEKGLYHWLIKGSLENRNVMENTLDFVEKARAAGIRIIHAPLVIDPENKKGWLAHLTFGKVFTKGTEKADISPGLFKKGDLCVTGRYAFDAFIGSDLEALLKENNISNVFICGFTTDQCVAKTMKTALEKGFNAYMVSDCTATMNRLFQKLTESKFQSNVTDHQTVLKMLNN